MLEKSLLFDSKKLQDRGIKVIKNIKLKVGNNESGEIDILLYDGENIIIAELKNQSLFNCHSENSKVKIEEFLKRADAGEDEMFETYNTKTGEREFFVPVRDSNKHVIGYFERHEMPWDESNPKVPVTEYWKHRR